MQSNPYYWPYWDENGSLEHHGVLGMKWGVRRYQNKDGTLTSAGRNRYGVSKKQYKSGFYSRDPKEDFTIPAKTQMYRVSYSDSDPKSNMYVTTNVKDRNYYKGNYANSFMGVGQDSSKLKERVYETSEEIRVPSFEKRQAAFAEIAKDPKIQAAGREALALQFIKRNALVKVDSIKDAKELLKGKSLDNEQKEVLKATIKGAPKYADTRMKDLDFSKDARLSAQAMSQLIGASDKIRDSYINVLKKQGYNATVDDYGRKGLWGTQGETSEALIIFDPGKSTSTKSNKNVSYRDSQKLAKSNLLNDYKYDAKVLGDTTVKEMLKIYNKQAAIATLSKVGGTAAGLLIPGGYSLVQTISAASSQKDIQRLRELEEERRKGYTKV